MLEDASFALPFGIGEGISEISKKQSALDEARICDLSFFASAAADFSEELFAMEMDLPDALSVLSDYISDISFGLEAHSVPLPENEPRIMKMREISSDADKLLLSSLYAEILAERGISADERALLPDSVKGSTVAYLKSAYADEAYDVFSEELDGATVKYVSSLKEAAELSASGGADYCLLPLEERGMRIATVAELITANDLRINSVTPVFGFDGSLDMKFALASRGYAVPERNPGDDRYLEVRCSSSSASLEKVIFAASFFGHSVYRVSTYTVKRGYEDETYFSLTLRDGGKGFSVLLIYIMLFASQYTVSGMYKNLE